MWFERLTGFQEKSPEYVRENLTIEGNAFVSKSNNRRFQFGELEVITLESLRQNDASRDGYNGKISVSEIVAGVMELHSQPKNRHALFQAASQFNLLEMVGPMVTPEDGIDRYESDYTQGPACAIACGAGTIYRNYFVPVRDQVGQTENQQIDCLDLIGKELDNEALQLWVMRNGYALASQEGLLLINKKIAQLTDTQREYVKGKLKVGIQWDTEVTVSPGAQKVSQIYCSALPVSYNNHDSIYWESFARIILEATYEATLYAAMLNLERLGSNVVYLTLVGGGAFGNEQYWILESLQKAIEKFRHVPLDVRVVSYRSSNPDLLSCLMEI